MQVWRDPSQVTFSNPVITLGFFDGVHRGHVKLLTELCSLAHSLQRPSLVLTLWPHPRIVLGNDSNKFKLLNTLETKIERIAQTGVDGMLLLNFDLALAELSALDFLEDIVYAKLHPAAILMGYDHHFGYKGQGDFALLNEFAMKHNLKAYQGEALILHGYEVSSTQIRTLLLEGQMEKAAEALGEDYGFYGTVVHGKQLGRTLGYPTANIQPLNGWQLLPSYGVYAGTCIIPSIATTQHWQALINVGTRPTVDNDGRISIEAYIPALNSQIYDQLIYISFHHKIRNELKFSTLEALKQQIGKDLTELQLSCNESEK